LQKLRLLFEDAIPLSDPGQAEVSQLFAKFAGSLAIVRFPHAERTSIMLNTMLAHEIGHALSQQRRLSESIANDVKIDPGVIEPLIDGILDALVPGAKSRTDLFGIGRRESLRTALINEILETVASWVEELTCDAIGFSYLGPAYLLSFVDFFLSQEGLDEPSSTHPPVRLRLGLLLSMMQTLGFDAMLSANRDPTFRAIHERVSEIQKLLKARKQERLDELSSLITPAVQGVQHVIVAKVLETIGESKYLPSRFQQDIPRLRELLDHFVPPCVLYDFDTAKMHPADVTSILNVGICFKIAHADKIYALFGAQSSEDRQIVDVKYNNLVLKAIELSDAFERATEGIADVPKQ
jgi:hypothetical protein